MDRLDRKVLLASLALCLLFVACYGLIVHEVRNWRAASAALVRSHQSAQDEGELHAALTRATGELASFAQSGRGSYAQEAAEALARAQRALDRMGAQEEGGVPDASRQAPAHSNDPDLLARQRAMVAQTRQTSILVQQAATPGVPTTVAAAAALLDLVYAHEEEADELEQDVLAWRAKERSRLQAAATASGWRVDLALAASAAVLLLSIGALVAYVRRRIVAPLDRLAEASAAVAGGDLERRVEETHRDEIGRVQQHFNIMVDELTAQRATLAALVEELSTARDAAQVASRAKSAFLTHVSHEISTPMNAVVVGMDLLAEGVTEPRSRELAGVARTAARQLRDMLGSLLEYASLESDRLSLRMADFEPGVLLRQATALYGAAAQAKGLALECRFTGELPARARGDGQALGQIVMNLLDNAVKYTERGRVTIEIDGSPGGLRVTVSDTGIGMTPEVMHQAFEPFYRAEAPALAHSSGIGLGLGIARELALQMGGSLECESTPGEGSTFRLDVPLVQPEATQTEGPAQAPPVALPVGRHVLVAEDNLDTLFVITRLLQSRGLVATGARDGREALAHATENDVDLVLMDCNMPGMNGFEAVKAIRALPGRRAAVPIVALTAYGLHEERQSYLDAGFDDLVAKPYSVEDIEAMLLRWLPRAVQQATGHSA